MTDKKNEKQTTSLQVLNYNTSEITFDLGNGEVMVNATQMAKPFGKVPKDWLRTEQSASLVKLLTDRLKCPSTDLVNVIKGGIKQGTWLHEDLALIFAQWLSPDFYLACNTKLKELLTKQVLELPSKHGVSPILLDSKLIYPYKDAMKVMGGSTRSSASKRKSKHPQHFIMVFGRNFVTEEYLNMLHSYYNYRNAQLKLWGN